MAGATPVDSGMGKGVPEDMPVAYCAECAGSPGSHKQWCTRGVIKSTDVPRPQETVNHPAHYTAYKGLEIIDLTEQMNFNRGNAVKYICRAGIKDKDKEIEDLEKASWYIDREINRLIDAKKEESND